MFWHVSVRRWFCLSTPRGLGGGYPDQGGVSPPWVPPNYTWLGGTLMGGTPPSRTWPGGPLMGGTPPWVSHLFRSGQGVPCQVQSGGVPHLGYPPIRPGQGGTPPQVLSCQTWLGGTLPGPVRGGYPTLGTPPSDLARGVPHLGYSPVRPGWGVPRRGGGYPISSSTWYAAVGMSLAFTQENFLVASMFSMIVLLYFSCLAILFKFMILSISLSWMSGLCLPFCLNNYRFLQLQKLLKGYTYLIFGHHLFDKTIPLMKRGYHWNTGFFPRIFQKNQLNLGQPMRERGIMIIYNNGTKLSGVCTIFCVSIY